MPTFHRLRLEVLPGRDLVRAPVAGQSLFLRWTSYDITDTPIASTGPSLTAERPDGTPLTLDPVTQIVAAGTGVWTADVVMDQAGPWMFEAGVSGPVSARDQRTATCKRTLGVGDAWPGWVAAVDSAAAAAASAAAAAAAQAVVEPAAATASAAAATATSQAAAAAASAALALGSSPALIGRWSQRLIETDGIPIIAGGYAEPYLGAPPSLAPNVALTRASKGWGFVDGVLTEFAVDTPRWVDWLGSIGVAPGNRARGLLIEGARTNGVRNPRWEGATPGSPGSYPTFMSTGADGGMTRTIVGTGVEWGLPYIDVRWAGTTVGLFFGISAESSVFVAAAQGQVWTGGFLSRLVGGTAAAITGSRETIFSRTSGGTILQTYTASGPAVSAALGLAQRTTAALPDATTAFVQPRLDLTMNAGLTADATIRFYLPGMEIGGFASSPILPPVGTPGASSRSRDVLPALTLAGPAMVLIEALVPALPTTSDGDMVLAQWGATDNDRIRLRIPAGTSNLVAGRVVGGVATDATVLGTVTAGVGFRALLGHNDGGTLVGCLNGGTAQTLTGAAVAPTALRLGNDIAGAAPLFGVVRQARAYLRYSTAEAVTLTA